MLIVFDIDGTLADISHRRHFLDQKPKDWKAFFAGMVNDPKNMPVALTYYALQEEEEFQENTLIIVSGRPDNYRTVTVDWLEGMLFMSAANCETDLYMRKEGDFRDDDIVKSEIFDAIEKRFGRKIDLSFDDRGRIVKMCRERGTPCFQVAEGDF